MAGSLSLVAGGAASARSGPAENPRTGSTIPRLVDFRSRPPGLGERWSTRAPPGPTLCELFAAAPRDGGWCGFLLAQIDRSKPVLWVQERMAILESGRAYPPGLGSIDILHVEARDARSALWAMEEGVRCAALSTVIGELYGDPAALDFTATRRLAVASERAQVPCWLVRVGGSANLSGARMRWRLASAPSLANPLDARAPGPPAWDAELFRARGTAPGRWSIAHEAGAFHLVAGAGGRALGEDERLTA